MHIGLFTQGDCGTGKSRSATVDALIAHRPEDCSIDRYAVPSVGAVLGARDSLQRAELDRIDLVHVTATGPLPLTALMTAWRFGLPTLASVQPAASGASRIYQAYVRALLRPVRRVLAASFAARKEFIRLGVPASKIAVWFPGVDCAMFAPSFRSNSLRERWGASEARPAVVYAGALSDDRGAERLLTLERALRRTRPMHQLVVAGDGPRRENLQARCPNVTFLGRVPRKDLAQVLASADLFVCPSEAISTNLGVLEAQASGLPVVVMDRGSARERASATSSVVCRSDADFIVETAALVRTDGRRTKMGIAARQHALQQRWEMGLMPVYAEYRAAAGSRRRRNLEPAFAPQSRRL